MVIAVRRVGILGILGILQMFVYIKLGSFGEDRRDDVQPRCGSCIRASLLYLTCCIFFA